MEISSEYSTALFALAIENGKANEYRDALNAIMTVISENPDYIDLLASPSIPKQTRLLEIDNAFADFAPQDIVSFIKVLCIRGRIKELFDCVKSFNQLVDEHNKISIAKVTSPIELSELQKAKLVQKLEKSTGNRVQLDCIVDESIIGGLMIEIDGRVIDGSVRYRLNNLKEVIKK